MSMTTATSGVGFDRPRIVPRSTATLLASAPSLPGAAQDNDRWLAGVQFLAGGTKSLTIEVMDFCDHDEISPLNTGDDAAIAQFFPFSVRVDEDATAVCFDQGDLNAWAEERIRSTESYAAGRGLLLGAGGGATGNPRLVGTTAFPGDTIAAAGAAPVPALAAIEDYLKDELMGAEGMIHVTPGLFTHIADKLVADGNRYRTKTGHIVVADAGYNGAVRTTGAAPAAGVTWAYATGMVYQRRSDVQVLGVNSEQMDLYRNNAEVVVTRQVLVVFDPTHLGGISVALP